MIGEEEEKDKNYTQWTIVGDGSFCPAPSTLEFLRPGRYEPRNHPNYGWTLMYKATTVDELYELPSEEITEIIDDLRRFWTKKELYAQYNFVYKRGILLYGLPGCGKSGIIQICVKDIIEQMSGIVISVTNEQTVEGYLELIPKLRQVEPDRPIIVILEDIDAIASESNWVKSQLLNILDGVDQISNVVYIATTNDPEKLAEHITNRPSRFDRRICVPVPGDAVRRKFLECKIGGTDITLDIDKWVKDTAELSLSHLKELFISVHLLDQDYDRVLVHLKGMKERPRNKKEVTIGFSK
jgi:AAA+ superfamily predicted ATPase